MHSSNLPACERCGSFEELRLPDRRITARPISGAWSQSWTAMVSARLAGEFAHTGFIGGAAGDSLVDSTYSKGPVFTCINQSNVFSGQGCTTAFVHSKGATVCWQAFTKRSIASRNWLIVEQLRFRNA